MDALSSVDGLTERDEPVEETAVVRAAGARTRALRARWPSRCGAAFPGERQ